MPVRKQSSFKGAPTGGLGSISEMNSNLENQSSRSLAANTSAGASSGVGIPGASSTDGATPKTSTSVKKKERKSFLASLASPSIKKKGEFKQIVGRGTLKKFFIDDSPGCKGMPVGAFADPGNRKTLTEYCKNKGITGKDVEKMYKKFATVSVSYLIENLQCSLDTLKEERGEEFLVVG